MFDSVLNTHLRIIMHMEKDKILQKVPPVLYF